MSIGCLLRVPLSCRTYPWQFISWLSNKKATLEQNAAAYIEKLQALDKSYTEGLSLSAKQRVLWLNTLCLSLSSLGLDLIKSLSGLSPDAGTVSRVAKAGVTGIHQEKPFLISTLEENASQALANTLKETGVKLDVLNPKKPDRGHEGW